MKIAMISANASPLAQAVEDGGQSVCVSNIARHLGRLGHAVDVFTRRDCEDVPPVVEMAPGVRVLHVPAGPAKPLDMPHVLNSLQEFGDSVLQFFAHARGNGEGYGLSHAHCFDSGPAAMEARKSMGVPMVVSFHSLARGMPTPREMQEAHQRRIDIEDAMAAQADRIVVECEQDREELLRLYGCDPEQVAVVPWGFDARELFPLERAVARAALSWDAEAFSILQLGRLRPHTGIDSVIRSLGIMRRLYGSQARLYVLGGPLEDHDDQSNAEAPTDQGRDRRAALELSRLRGVAQGESVSDHVTFLACHNRELLHVFYGAADVFVASPWSQPSGLTSVEAMACARPVVGANIGGVAAAILHGITGYTVQPRDPHMLAERLRDLMRDPDQAAAMGAAGRARAINCYTWESAAHRLETLYGPVLTSRSRVWRPRLRLIQGRRGAPELAKAMDKTIQPMSAHALSKNQGRQRAVFLDKDRTLLSGFGSEMPREARLDATPMLMRFAPGIRAALRHLGALEVRLIVLDNGSGERKCSFAERAMLTIGQRLKRMFAECGAIMTGFYYCPHEQARLGTGFARSCACRRPNPGLLLRAAAEHNLDITRSWMVCAGAEDIEAGRDAGCGTILIDNGAAASWTRGSICVPDYAVSDLDAAARLIDCFQPALGK
jgi:HAD superfamily hydrolase (TIGR01662 family)